MERKQLPKEQQSKNHSVSQKDQLKALFPDTEDKHLDVILESNATVKVEGGYSSGLVLGSPDIVAKQAPQETNQHEANVYSWNLGEFEKLRPQMVDLIELKESSVLVLENILSRPWAFSATGFNPIVNGRFSRDIYIKHSLTAQGIFHKEATREVKTKKHTLPGLIYQTLDGVPHYEAIEIPLDGTTGQVYREFKEIPSGLVKRIGPIIDNVCQQIQEGNLSVIHGDWKIGNMPNGYVVDYAITRWGKEIEDIAYFLSEPNLRLSKDQMTKYLEWYIGKRSEHDQDFRWNTNKHQEMRRDFDGVRMKELSIYTSCTRKRPLHRPEFMQRRKQLLYLTQEHLRTGTFANI